MASIRSTILGSDDIPRQDTDRGWYGSVLSNISMFKRSGGKTDDLSSTDTPGHFYFKIFFYFDNPGESGGLASSNLLSPYFNSKTLGSDSLPWEKAANSVTDAAARSMSQFASNALQGLQSIGRTGNAAANSALNYLLINNEWERAEKLTKFISLLSNISTYSPWYFSEITGLDVALERKEVTERDFKLEETRKQISIVCLPDAYDTRIGTLLDLYRDIVWSQQLHKEILPANLRKFDMGIYIFNTPVKNIHGKDTGYAKYTGASSSEYRTSAKYIELQNCEIDYNSSKSALAQMNNTDGVDLKYTITISFDNAMEMRYNEILMREIGDFTNWDMSFGADPTWQRDDKTHFQEFENRLNAYKSKGLITNAVDQAFTSAYTHVEGFVKKVSLGNLHTMNVRGMMDTADRLLSGNIIGGVASAQQLASSNNKKEQEQTRLSSNIGKKLWTVNPPKTKRAERWAMKKSFNE